jgi:hypothetical protein
MGRDGYCDSSLPTSYLNFKASLGFFHRSLYPGIFALIVLFWGIWI